MGYWDEPVPPGAGRVVVVGAGLTAAHLVSNALAAGAGMHWVIRETGERYQCADVNSSFFRPEGRFRFDGVSWEDRLTLMGRFRRASVMFEFRPLFERAEADGRLTVHRGSAVAGVTTGSGTATVRLESGARVAGDNVLLALGTSPSIGFGLLPDEVVNARDGWPDLDECVLAYNLAPAAPEVAASA